jgi:hypothetical protein
MVFLLSVLMVNDFFYGGIKLISEPSSFLFGFPIVSNIEKLISNLQSQLITACAFPDYQCVWVIITKHAKSRWL